jgi:hypothetical protein
VNVVGPRERGEKGTMTAWCNAEGHFLPQVLISKDVNKNQEFWDGVPNEWNQSPPTLNRYSFWNSFRKDFIQRMLRGNSSLFSMVMHFTVMNLSS